MPEVQELATAPSSVSRLPVSAIVATRNEEKNLARCLQSLAAMGEVYVVDSGSTDTTVEIARSFGVEVIQFHYTGGWPKKRQWAIDTLPLSHDWILLIDADESVTPQVAEEIRNAICNPYVNGYYLSLQIHFLGRVLRHGDANFWKMALFRRGKGRFECRLKDQSPSMADMEVHEHVVIDGPTAKLRNPLIHHNVESLSRYIQKHDEYSNWEASVLLSGSFSHSDLPPRFFGTQAQRRRWLKNRMYAVPGSPLLLFLYRYVLRGGFLDGVPGLIYCCFQAIQMFHTKAKIYELKRQAAIRST